MRNLQLNALNIHGSLCEYTKTGMKWAKQKSLWINENSDQKANLRRLTNKGSQPSARSQATWGAKRIVLERSGSKGFRMSSGVALHKYFDRTISVSQSASAITKWARNMRQECGGSEMELPRPQAMPNWWAVNMVSKGSPLTKSKHAANITL